MSLPVNPVGGIAVGCVDEAEDLAGLLVYPVVAIGHPEVVLDPDVGCVRADDVGRVRKEAATSTRPTPPANRHPGCVRFSATHARTRCHRSPRSPP